VFAVKTEITDLKANTFVFARQKTMYGGKHIADGDVIFVFASENEGGPGLIARGIVSSSQAMPLVPDIGRQTPRVSITVRRTAPTTRRLGRNELGPFSDWADGRPQTELNFKLYRQATNKIVGLTSDAGAFLDTFFQVEDAVLDVLEALSQRGDHDNVDPIRTPRSHILKPRSATHSRTVPGR
jgi:hypothetical protein